MSRIDGNLSVSGYFSSGGMACPSNSVATAAIYDSAVTRAKIAQETLVAYPVPLTSLRVWNAFQTVLPNPSASDDLGMYGGTFASGSQYIATYDVKTAGAVTLYARCRVALPAEYDAAESVSIRICQAKTSATAGTSSTVDVEAYRVDKGGGIGSDLCATAAQSINSATAADKDFVITPTTLNPGDELDVRITVAVNDAAGGSPVIAQFGGIDLMCDIRG